MQQIIINVGVSGSGKTTWSINHMKLFPNTLRINRDDVRKVLIGDLKGYYKRSDLNSIENSVTSIETYSIVEVLRRDHDLILDNTHLKPSYIKEKLEMIEYWSKALKREMDIKFKLFKGIDVFTLKNRVHNRDGIPWQDLNYIDKQVESLKSIEKYLEENHKNQIIND